MLIVVCQVSGRQVTPYKGTNRLKCSLQRSTIISATLLIFLSVIYRCKGVERIENRISIWSNRNDYPNPDPKHTSLHVLIWTTSADPRGCQHGFAAATCSEPLFPPQRQYLPWRLCCLTSIQMWLKTPENTVQRSENPLPRSCSHKGDESPSETW